MSVMQLVVRNMLSVQGISVKPAGYILTSERLLYVIYNVYVNPVACIPDNNNFKLPEFFLGTFEFYKYYK